MKRLLSGIKPTGDLTLGNYIGAIRNFIKLQDSYESFVFVADLHALTTGEVSPKELEENRKKIVALYLACGLNPEKTTIFYQSDLYEHGVMNWLCTCETTVGELQRMTQYKDKAEKFKQNNNTFKIPSGILCYPTLMAADILLYNADLVPVGEDQTQHLELTRNIAQRFNRKYDMDFKIPEGYIPQVGARIMSLQNPDSKMSKSEKSEKATIYLLEDPEKAYKKILKAVTDSEGKVYISKDKPGVLNLLTIYSSLTNISLEEAAKKFEDIDYKVFKIAVAQEVKKLLESIQIKYKEALQNIDYVVSNGAIKAKKVANTTLTKLMKKMGFN